MGQSNNQLLRNLERNFATYSSRVGITVLAGNSNSEWFVLPNCFPKFASLVVPDNIPASVTVFTFRIRDDDSDMEGKRLITKGAEREIMAPGGGGIIEPIELIGLSTYLNDKRYQAQLRMNDMVTTETIFYLDTP